MNFLRESYTAATAIKLYSYIKHELTFSYRPDHPNNLTYKIQTTTRRAVLL